ncbi:MAG: ATP citrate lyase citrate-binding domain-containing protein [Candidatus Daviesbacteria bacterium]|nr:ATP citrate lyase citrate-binding domain-containing protein [Candidatus Daviesbacteria bacterium]
MEVYKSMILYEFEGKEILKQAGINVPDSQLIKSSKEKVNLNFPVVLKAQVLSGKRAAVGGIVVVEKAEDLEKSLVSMFSQTINQEKVEKVLVEEKIEFENEAYLSITYDTDFRSPVLSISESGGTGIEEKLVNQYKIDPLTMRLKDDHSNLIRLPQELIDKLIVLFFAQDCLLLEINPLVKTAGSEWLALDAKLKLDDDASFRHQDWIFPPRLAPGKNPTQNEIEAKKIDEGDYRGTAGSAYFDLEGDIAILSSGGGVSLTAMDALLESGGKPANFTEYSGNPPREKVIKLTKIVLSKPNLHGLWIVGTVAANFTDIYETLMGIIDGLREVEKELKTKFNFPIIIRRGGPREEEAFAALQQVKDFNLILQGEEVSIQRSAKIMAEQAKQYETSI